jgi:hypothetical protein
MVHASAMKLNRMRVIVVCLVAGVMAAGCDNNSPSPGQGCASVGGVCASGVCSGESLPYPCPANESCCTPTGDGSAKLDPAWARR